jgi:hypothetical protein
MTSWYMASSIFAMPPSETRRRILIDSQACENQVLASSRPGRCPTADRELTPERSQADHITEAEVLTPDGTEPYLAVIAEAMVESATGRGGHNVARQTFRQLCRQGVSPEEARIEIGRILLGVYSLTGTRQMPIEQSQHTIDVCLRRLAAGETESQIFGVESQDPSAASDGG